MSNPFKLREMKKNLTLLCFAILFIIGIYGQNSGKGFNYQGIARNSKGEVLASSSITLKFSLLTSQASTSPAWQETQTVTTDQFGTFAVNIGKGTKTNESSNATFSAVNFSAASYWLKVEILDGETYKEISTTQLLSVPYAEVAGNASSIPVGTIMVFAGDASKVPAGWLLCDGRELNSSDYPSLFGVIGSSWGGSISKGGLPGITTKFNLPDLRGVFLRGVDSDRGLDPDKDSRTATHSGGNTKNNVGSYEEDNFRSHNHWGNTEYGNAKSYRLVYNRGKNTANNHQTGYDGNEGYEDRTDADWSNADHTHNIKWDGGNETRPKNVYVNYIIKY